MSTAQPTCGTCRFMSDPPSGFTICRRYPPQPPHGPQFVHLAGWCGEHQPREAEPEPKSSIADRCNLVLQQRKLGSWPRTCAECGLRGPCKVLAAGVEALS